MFENPRRGRQARNFTTNVPKILDLISSSEQIFFRKLSLGAPEEALHARVRLGPVVQKVDSAIHRINHYPADSTIHLLNNWDLSGIDEESFSAMMRISFQKTPLALCELKAL